MIIQLSTDCVFSGKKGMYIEKDSPDADDIYGRSKIMGELNYKKALTLRKSTIGFELENNHGLFEWWLNSKIQFMVLTMQYILALPPQL